MTNDTDLIFERYCNIQEGIFQRGRAKLNAFGETDESLQNLINQYTKKIGKHVGDLEADLKTFKGSLQPITQEKMAILLNNLNSAGVESAQSALGKIGHMLGRFVGAAAPAAAVTALAAGTGGLGGIATGALAGATRGLQRNLTRTDIDTKNKFGNVAKTTAAGAAIGGVSDFVASKLANAPDAGFEPAGPPSELANAPSELANAPDAGLDLAGAPSELANAPLQDTIGAMPELPPMNPDLFQNLHNSSYDPNSIVDQAKMLLQQQAEQQGITDPNEIANFVYRNGGIETLDSVGAEEIINNFNSTVDQIASQAIEPGITFSELPTDLKSSAEGLYNQMIEKGYSAEDASNELSGINDIFAGTKRVSGDDAAVEVVKDYVKGVAEDIASPGTSNNTLNVLQNAARRGRLTDEMKQLFLNKAIERGATDGELQAIMNLN